MSGSQKKEKTAGKEKIFMARLNDVRLYGVVSETPQITKNTNGDYVRAIMHLAVARSTRYSGETFGEKNRILFDWPIILSRDPEMIKQIEKLREFDVVEIKGMFLTKKINKIATCKVCGCKNVIEGNICYVRPMFLRRRNSEREVLTEKQAVQEVMQEREVSNNILIVGNLCNEVNYFRGKEGKKEIETSVYQIATDRKFYVKEDSPDNKTDFPIVRSYKETARMDHLCLQTSSLVLVDGFLHSREFTRTSTCSSEGCGQDFEWTDNTTEIVPYTNEYLANYKDPEEALKEAKEQEIAEGDMLFNQILSH